MYPNLKLQLWKSGIRQNRLAQMLHVDESMISKVINGFREPTRDLKRRIAELLGCDEQWLFEPARPFADLPKMMTISEKLERP
jgi:plasmid maintenance system antidote protein VapI